MLVVIAVGVYAWASFTTNRLRAQTFETHSVDFPIPFPIDPAEAPRWGSPRTRRGSSRSSARSSAASTWSTARYTCTACHGANFGGGVMVDAFPIGSLLAPNLTLGTGSRTADFQPRDWDRIVRHGVLRDGHPAVMPSEDFQHMSDQELSDIISYIRSLPPVNNTVPTSTFGPLGKILVATGQMKFSASVIASHTSPHEVRPPAERFGRVRQASRGGLHGLPRAGFQRRADCGRRPELAAGPQPHARRDGAEGLDLRSVRHGALQESAARRHRASAADDAHGAVWTNMTDVERQALWAYLQSLPPVSKVIPKP